MPLPFSLITFNTMSVHRIDFNRIKSSRCRSLEKLINRNYLIKARKNKRLIAHVNHYVTVFTVYLQHDYATRRGHTSYPCKLAITVEISVPPLMRAWVNTICSEYLSIRNLNPSVGNFISVQPGCPPRSTVSISLPRSDARMHTYIHIYLRFPTTKFNRHDRRTDTSGTSR